MNCLKCGRTVADGELFCHTCNDSDAYVEQESRLHLHAHEKVLPIVAAPQTSPKRPNVRRLQRWCVILSVVSVILFALVALRFAYIWQIRSAQLQYRPVAVDFLERIMSPMGALP